MSRLRVVNFPISKLFSLDLKKTAPTTAGYQQSTSTATTSLVEMWKDRGSSGRVIRPIIPSTYRLRTVTGPDRRGGAHQPTLTRRALSYVCAAVPRRLVHYSNSKSDYLLIYKSGAQHQFGDVFRIGRPSWLRPWPVTTIADHRRSKRPRKWPHRSGPLVTRASRRVASPQAGRG